MRVLLTGNEGYIGTILVPWLWVRNHEVIGLDSRLFRECTLRSAIRPVPTIRKDVRDVELRDLDGFEAVIHLAGLSNDPLGNLNPRLTFEMNHQAAVRLAELANGPGSGGSSMPPPAASTAPPGTTCWTRTARSIR